MKRTDIINKLSKELSIALGKQEDFELIKTYIQAAIVTEMDRAYGEGKMPSIICSVNPKTGQIMDEFWGVKEISEHFKEDYFNTKTKVNRCIRGDQRLFNDLMWKKL